jgi:tRNA(Ile)-lysidine synthase
MTATNRRLPLVEKLALAWPAKKWCDVTVLIAVSGGADSVALVRALHQPREAGEGRLVLAHFNHRLRGAESDADQAFVEQLGRELGLESIIAARRGEGQRGREGEESVSSSEESLRTLRYAFLSSAAGQCGARYVATAHTADDQVETVLVNLLRGTGLAGLAGIPRVRQLTDAATLIRPLLDVTRAEVLDYLNSIDQPFRQDSSNTNRDYTRNRIRHELLPLLERDYNPRVREALGRLSRLAGEADDEINGLAAELVAQIFRRSTEGIDIPVEDLARFTDFMARTLLRAAWRWQGWPEQNMGLDEWDELLLLSQSLGLAPRMFPGGIRAERTQGFLRLTRP